MDVLSALLLVEPKTEMAVRTVGSHPLSETKLASAVRLIRDARELAHMAGLDTYWYDVHWSFPVDVYEDDEAHLAVHWRRYSWEATARAISSYARGRQPANRCDARTSCQDSMIQ